MVKSVQIYGGFYVGRYETNSQYGSTKGVWPVYGKDWYTLYNEHKKKYDNEKSSVVSGMIYGCQWDAMMKWMADVPNVQDNTKLYIFDSTGMGNYSGTYEKTGYYEVKNIYDLAGNQTEWTQEGYHAIRSVRGGAAMADPTEHPASGKGSINAYENNGTYRHLSTRLQLYIK